ncbi:hypothetical protein BC826DRAFT_1109418 [Russula brevipes]|nr:hypothetical protein BC826DRAFT_1109418 [Russula brevipes]
MHVNSPPLYESYLPQRFYRPASHYLDDGPSSAFAFDGLAYSPSFHAFPPQIDTETRYRRALHELKAAEQELGAYIALEHARQRQATLLRQRAVAEAARHERTLALQAETRRIQRIEHARLLRTQVEDRAARRQRALLRTLVDADAKQVPVPRHHFVEIRPTRSRPTPPPAHRDEEVLSVGELLGLLAGIRPETQPISTPERHSLRTPSEFHRPAEHQSQPPKHNDTPVASQEFLEFLHGIASQSRTAGGYQPVHQPNAASNPETIPLNEKAEGKAKAESVPLPILLQALFSERIRGAPDQEMRDVEQAIKLSTQGRGVVDARKGRASKVAGSSPGASSSKVKIDGSSSLGPAASPRRSPASASIPSPAPQPVSSLTTIRTVRSQASALQSAFKFPPVLDFDHSDFAISANNAPVRAYEYALNGLLEQLDAIESDGNEEIRDARREVVREVEKALEDVERKVKERAPRATTTEVTKEEVKGYDVESEEREAAPAIPPADAGPIAKDAKPVLPDAVLAVPPADADVIQAISEEYRSASPASGSEVAVAELRKVTPSDAVSSTLERANSEAVLAFDDFSDSTATITPGSAAPATNAIRSSNVIEPASPETFLGSMSHDQFTFPPKPASHASSGSGEAHEDAVLLDDASEGGSVGSTADGWSEVDA